MQNEIEKIKQEAKDKTNRDITLANNAMSNNHGPKKISTLQLASNIEQKKRHEMEKAQKVRLHL